MEFMKEKEYYAMLEEYNSLIEQKEYNPEIFDCERLETVALQLESFIEVVERELARRNFVSAMEAYECNWAGNIDRTSNLKKGIWNNNRKAKRLNRLLSAIKQRKQCHPLDIKWSYSDIRPGAGLKRAIFESAVQLAATVIFAAVFVAILVALADGLGL